MKKTVFAIFAFWAFSIVILNHLENYSGNC